MDAVLLAAGTPSPEEPLYAYTQGRPKVLLEVAGKPMVQWVVDALTQAQSVERIFVVGLTPQQGLTSSKPMHYLADAGGLLANIMSGLQAVRRANPDAGHVLLVSGDIPALTAEMVDWTAANAARFDADVIYHAVTRTTMEARFPGANRTYLRLRDVEVCGCDLNIAHSSIAERNNEMFARIIAARKNPLRQAALLGWKTLLMVALRRWTLQQAAQAVSARLGLRGAAVISPYAEMAMDADKPYQVDLLRADLARRER